MFRPWLLALTCVATLTSLAAPALAEEPAAILPRDAALQILAQSGISLPVTGFAHSTKDIDGLLDTVGGAPVVVKLLEGTQGMGVVLAETKKAAESVIGAFRQLDANILVQEFIREARGADIRAFVVGGRVVASSAAGTSGIPSTVALSHTVCATDTAFE